MRTCLITFCSLSMMGSTAQAGVNFFMPASRSVSGNTGIGGVPSMAVTSDLLGLFEERVSDAAFDDLTGGFGSYEATQTSIIGGSSVSATGFVSASADTDGFAIASSRLSVAFGLSEASGYRAEASLFDLSQGELTFSFFARLTDGGGDGDIVWQLSSGSEIVPDTGSFSFDTIRGVLEAGNYLLEVDVFSSGIKSTTTEGGFAFDFVVPSPATSVSLLIVGPLATRRRRG